MLGGGQESGRRSGTQNVVGAVGFAAACREAAEEQEAEAARLRGLRDRLYGSLTGFGPVEATVDVAEGSEDFLPNIVNVLVDGLESETLVLRYDRQGFGVSGGSACSSRSLEPSHVLRAIGIDAGSRARGSAYLDGTRHPAKRCGRVHQRDSDGAGLELIIGPYAASSRSRAADAEVYRAWN